MNIVTLLAPVRKTWTEEKCQNIGTEIGICPACASINTFQYISTCNRWYWDIDIPENWVFGQWEQIKLFPVQVPIPVYSCTECNLQLKINPSFCLRGTTLTLQALSFIGFVYETTELAWRALPEKLCEENNTIAHSTLYKAVHGAGKLITTAQEIQKLYLKYLPPTNNPDDQGPTSIWPPPKSIYTCTVTREQGLRLLLANLLPGKSLGLKFQEYFYRYLNILNRIFAGWNKAISNIYGKLKTDP
jgi:hypothetical protein